MDVADAAAAVSREQADTTADTNPDPDPGEPEEEIEEIEEIDSEPNSVLGRLKQPLDGSITEDRVGELWNPELGGLNRLVLVIEETAGLGDGIPRAGHAVISVIEMAEEPPDALKSITGADDDPTEETEETEETEPSEPSTSSNADTQEVINYDG